MNRIKMFSILSVLVFIIIVLSENVFAALNINSDGTVHFDRLAEMYNSGNVFCVAHHQEMRRSNISCNRKNNN